jgi:hypothetical protein
MPHAKSIKDAMPENSKSRKLIVAGDVTIDWNIAHTERMKGGGAAWSADNRTSVFRQCGGAALLANLMDAVARDLGKGNRWLVLHPSPPDEEVLPYDSRFNHSHAVWSIYEDKIRVVENKKAKEVKINAWRVKEFLGLDRGAPAGHARTKNDQSTADVVLIDDANLGFRDNQELWPGAIVTKGYNPWIIVKMARPFVQSALLDNLRSTHAGKLIVVIGINDLRQNAVHISRGLSWERAAQELAWELQYNPVINALSDCANVIVPFDMAGALLYSCSFAKKHSTNGSEPRFRLFYDPAIMEGMWGEMHAGGMIGYNTCLTAAVARQVMLDSNKPDLCQAVRCGLSAMRTLHMQGYGDVGGDQHKNLLVFPSDAVAKELSRSSSGFALVDVKEPGFKSSATGSSVGPEDDYWMILSDKYSVKLGDTARDIIRRGIKKAIKEVPVGTFGKLTTLDRNEIESYHSVRRLIREYCAQKQNRPLNIAVFGPPGSGKSFGVTQVAESVLPGQMQVLTFNLSQLNDPDDLAGAFHLVRDVAIAGKIPLVFWDEFDTSLNNFPLGWLRYFLAPMQDGSFLEGQVTHPLGRSIFVFAGGTSHTMAEFGEGLNEEGLRAAKVPDFVSRLKGYVNVLGPNRQGERDRHHVIRRAILLRSLLERNAPQLCVKQEDGTTYIHLDDGLLRALLETAEYRHGARSMESLVAMSLLSGKSSFERSSLPPVEQLKLHVDPDDFHSLLFAPALDDRQLDALASAAHEVFCEHLRLRGYKWGQTTDEKRKMHSSLVEYDKLPDFEKDQNRDNVKDIPRKLAQVGFAMVPAVPGRKSDQFTKGEIELLAEMEHDRWVKFKLSSGWRWARRTDKQKRLHQYLIPWRKMSPDQLKGLYDGCDVTALGPGPLAEAEKEKDRKLVRGIATIVAHAGYVLTRIGR